MNLQIARWGNSLAFRRPASVVRQLGLWEGLTVHAQVTPDGTQAIQAAEWRRSAFAAEPDATRAALPMGQSVADERCQASQY